MTQTDTNTDATDTIAKILCDRFVNDGQHYHREFLNEETGEECVESAVDVFEDWAIYTRVDSHKTKYVFRDGSTIVECDGAGYDVGFTGCGCFCWEGAGHHAGCPHATRSR